MLTASWNRDVLLCEVLSVVAHRVSVYRLLLLHGAIAADRHNPILAPQMRDDSREHPRRLSFQEDARVVRMNRHKIVIDRLALERMGRIDQNQAAPTDVFRAQAQSSHRSIASPIKVSTISPKLIPMPLSMLG